MVNNRLHNRQTGCALYIVFMGYLKAYSASIYFYSVLNKQLKLELTQHISYLRQF